MTITLDVIKTEQTRLAEMIAAFEKQPMFPIEVSFPHLNDGELYVGAIISACGTKRHHVILLPGDSDSANWKAQMDWANSIGGDLPDRVEQALLFAVMKDQFQAAAYWSREEHASDSDYAWFQHFGSGSQGCSHEDSKLRARAVRRLVIE
jgi:hypothetical protein